MALLNCSGAAVGVEILAEAAPSIATDHIELRLQEVLVGFQFRLALLDLPLLAAQFGPSRETFGETGFPVEDQLGLERLFGRANQATITDRQSGQQSQPTLDDVDAARATKGAARAAVVGAGSVDQFAVQGVLGLFFEAEVLLAGLGLFFGFTAATAPLVQGMNPPPGIEGGIAGRDLGVEIAIGEVEIPVGVLDIAGEVANAQLEVGQSHIRVDAGNHHAVDRAGLGVRSRQSIEAGAAALQQRVPGLNVVPGRERTAEAGMLPGALLASYCV